MFIPRKLYINSLYLITVTLPFTLKANNIGIFLLIVSWFWGFSNRKNLTFIFSSKMSLAGLGIALLLVLSLLHTEDMYRGFKELEIRASWLIFPVAMSGLAFLEREIINKVLKVFVIATVVATLISLVIALLKYLLEGTYIYIDPYDAVHENYFLYHQLSGHVSLSSLYLGYYVAFSIIIITLYLLDGTNKVTIKNRVLSITVIIYLFFYILLLQSVSVIGGLLLVLVIIGFRQLWISTFLSTRRKFGLAALILISLVVTTLLFKDKIGINRSVFQYEIDKMPSEKEAWNSLTFRLANWSVTSDMIMDNWLFGVGAGDFQKTLNEYHLQRKFLFGYHGKLNPHNQFLQTFAMLGIPGFLLLIFIYYCSFRMAVKQKDLIIFSFFAFMLFVSQFESVFARNKGIVFFCFFAWLFYYSFLKIKNKSIFNDR